MINYAPGENKINRLSEILSKLSSSQHQSPVPSPFLPFQPIPVAQGFFDFSRFLSDNSNGTYRHEK